MKKTPDENENEDIVGNETNNEVREFAEQLPGYQEYQREQRGDELNFGDM